MSELQDMNLIHDWNLLEPTAGAPTTVEVEDRTLGEGLRTPQTVEPTLDGKLRLLHLQEKLRLHASLLGTPALCRRQADDVLRLAREVREQGMKLLPGCYARAVVSEVEQAATLAQQAGLPVELCLRVSAETSGDAPAMDALEDAVVKAVREHLAVKVMIDDASCAHPGNLRRILQVAIDAGVSRLCLCDGAGVASPSGCRHLMRFAANVIEDRGASIEVEWFGRNDRDLAVINSLQALSHGAVRLHGTVLGLGDGAGWTPLDLLLVNLRLMEVVTHDLTPLREYCQAISHEFGVAIPVNYPVFGEDAFRTATGVHAAAIIKAQAKGHTWLADRVYSGVPAGVFGMHQTIDIGPMSGESNVVAWLRHRNLEVPPEVVKRIVARAKKSTHTLSQDEVYAEIQSK